MTLSRSRTVNLLTILTLLLISPSCAHVSAHQVSFPPSEVQQTSSALETVASKARELPTWTANAETINKVLREFETISQGSNPLPQKDIEYVFVLSARSTYKGETADPKGNPDQHDDQNRMNLGIYVAREITALRTGKPASTLTLEDLALRGPTIIYNGIPLQNNHLREATIAGRLQIPYPREKFLIAELPPDQMHTLGQFLSLKRLIRIERTSVAVVTHAFHFPRVSRLLNSKAHSCPFGSEVKVFPFLVDRHYQAPGAINDMMGEIDRIPKYILKKDLFPEPI